MEGHEEKVAEAEFELAEMEEQSDSLAEDIEAAKNDWQQKQDASVPGAGLGDEDDEDDEDATGEGAVEVDEDEKARSRLGSVTRPASAVTRADPRGAGMVAREQLDGRVRLRRGHDGDEAAAHVEDLPHLGVGDARRARATSPKTGGTGSGCVDREADVARSAAAGSAARRR